jgi:hypothetical protein
MRTEATWLASQVAQTLKSEGGFVWALKNYVRSRDAVRLLRHGLTHGRGCRTAMSSLTLSPKVPPCTPRAHARSGAIV